MKNLKSSLSKLSAVAVVLGLAACSHNQQASQPPTTYAQQTPSTSDQYGSTMGQSSASGTANGSSTSTGGAMNGQGQGTADQNGTMQGQTGSQDQYGTQGQQGSQYGAGGTMGGAQGSSTSNGALGTTGTTGSQLGSSSSGATGAMGGAMDVSSLNDGQLAAVLVALNQGEIQEAQLAQTKAKSPEVKKLAQHMATAHQGMLTKGQALFSQLQITPSDNAVSQQLQSDAQNQMSTLQSMRGGDFDRDYVDDQVKAHNQALELVDRMIPNAKNPQLKSELEALRPKLQQHLQEAEKVQQKLQQGSTNKQGTDTGSPGSAGGSGHGSGTNPGDLNNQH